MPLDPTIPLQVAQPPPLQDPLTRVLTLREMMQRQQLQAAQTQEYQQRITQQQRQIDADQFLAKAYSDNLKTAPDGTVSVDYGGVKRTIAADGRYGSKIIDVDKEDQAALKASIEKQDAAIKLVATHAQRAGELLGAVDDAPTPEAKAHFLKGAQAQAKAEGLPLPADLDVPAYTPDMDAHIHVLAQAAMDRAKQLKAHLDQSKEIRDQLTFETQQPAVKAKALNEQIAAAAPQLAQAGSQTEWDGILAQYPGVKGAVGSMWSPAAAQKAAMLAVPVKELPEYEIMRRAAKGTQPGAANDYEATINATIHDPGNQQAAKAEIAKILASAPPNLKEPGSQSKAAQEVIARYQGQEATTQRELKLIAPRAAAATATAVATQRALNVGDDPELASVKAPRLAVTARTEAQKADNEYAAAKNAGEEMRTMVDLMRAHNKVAYAYEPVTGVLTINAGNQIKRINMAEIQSYAGAGNFKDRVEGWIGKQLTGESIPAGLIKDIEQMHAALQQNSYKQYADKLDAINKRTPGAKLTPAYPAPGAAAASTITTPTTQAEFNALPKGARFKKPNDPTIYVKQ